MAKETYYFSHDSNARNDEKILMLRAEHGWQGYGLYWALLEMMFEAKETCLSHAKVKGIAISYNVDITLLQSVINTCEAERLFVSDGVVFWSDSLRDRKQKFLELRQQRADAGKKGMAKRWGSDNGVITKNNGVITEVGSVITKNNKVKESKEKEKKEKEKKENESKDDDSPTTITLSDAIKTFNQNIHLITPLEAEKLEAYIEDGFDATVITYAIQKAVMSNARNMAYIDDILKKLRTANIMTMEAVESAERDFEAKKHKKQNPQSAEPVKNPYPLPEKPDEETMQKNREFMKGLMSNIGKSIGG